jgi:hypothetical protein
MIADARRRKGGPHKDSRGADRWPTPADLETWCVNVAIFRSLPARVQAGTEYLDRTFPGWFTRVSTRNLNMRSPSACVLAQVTGAEYFAARRRCGFHPDEGVAYGFIADRTQRGYLRTATEDLLTVLWRAAIYYRRRERPSRSRL